MNKDFFCSRPVFVTLLGSLLLSLVAYLGAVTIGKDGAFYVDIAQTIALHGLEAGAQRFNWIGFPALLAGLHQLTGLPIEGLAYAVCAVLMAGTCTLMVDLIRREMPQAVWWAVLVVLAMPAFNAFRSDIIREHGFWFFSVLTLWLAYWWRAGEGWWRALAIQCAIGGAVFFRLEAVFLEVALALWLLPGLRSRKGWLHLVQVFWLPVLAFIAVVMTLSMMSSSRVSYYLTMINPLQVYFDFKQLSDQFSSSLKYKYSRDDAGIVVFFGVIFLIGIKFLKLSGVFSFLLFFSAARHSFVNAVSRVSLSAVMAAVYFIVLLVFFYHEQFVNSRYQSFMNLVVVPAFSFALYGFVMRFPRMKKIAVALCVIFMLANVVSLSAKKTHYIEAGRWLSDHASVSDSIYYDDARVGYYAGFGYGVSGDLQSALSDPGKYRYLVIEANAGDGWLNDFLKDHSLRVLAAFSNRKKDSIVVVGD